jgi:hypothetical protein
MPTPATTTSVVPGPFVFTLTTSHIWAKGGLMVVAIDWPIARGDRHSRRSRRPCSAHSLCSLSLKKPLRWPDAVSRTDAARLHRPTDRSRSRKLKRSLLGLQRQRLVVR